MKATTGNSSFLILEQNCEFLFSQNGPYWHLYTDGNKSDIIFTCKEDFIVGMNLLAVSAITNPDVRIYTFELMNNHLHIIMSGDRYRCRMLFTTFKKKLQRYFARNGKCINLSDFECSMIEITDLRMLRNEIAYVNRNGFVANSRYTPFSYPWGAGSAYFNPFLKGLAKERFCNLPLRERRNLCKSREAVLPDHICVHDGVILPSSYCHLDSGESLFRNAAHYFNTITKNYDAYSAIAGKLHETVFIADEEMYSAVVMLCIKHHNIRQPSLLPAREKVEMAKIMHRDYNASNRQIRNILKLEKEIVDGLFPGEK
jgi:hypothetical protein